ncbi:MAG TPA: ABC transporter permease [Vicinamibacterales bacterium]|jgi:lipopolysaccharide transport system permease protein|nr:ABC transporter permease [Vicinamibacterales bacterium]
MDDATSPLRTLSAPRWTATGLLWQLVRLGDYYDLLLVLSRHRISVRYKQSVLGGVWAILQPVAMMLVFTVVFARLARFPSNGVPYALFAYAGLLPWTFFSGAVSAGTGSLVGHASLITKIYFPREILPLSYVVASVVDLLIGSSVLVALALIYHVKLTPELVVVVPTTAVLGAFALACGLILSAVQVRFRDIGMALPIGLQLLMFASPVLYPMEMVPLAWRHVYALNPLAGLIDTFRRSALGLPLDPLAFLTGTVVTAVALPLAYAVFKHAEVTIADHV